MKTTFKNTLGCVFLLCCVLLSATGFAAPKLEYIVSMDEPHTHFFEVEMIITDIKKDYIDVKMAAWTPGSYLIREYARHVESFEAKSGKQPLKAEKVLKNTWRIYSNNADKVVVKYKVYAFELTVRTSFLDQSHGYINGASVFMFIDKQLNLPSTLTVKPYKEWKHVTTSLTPVTGAKYVYQVPDFDILADSPIEIGNHEVFTFDAVGIPHTVAMYGKPEYNKERLIKDMTRIIESATAVVGENPCKDYTFIIHSTLSGGGGLEHLNSTTLQTSRFAFINEKAYTGFLSLVAHEYFHLWNVKRIRPMALGPFDYENENYTSLLWVSEGFTSYYDELLLRRAGIYTPEKYLEVAASAISTVENQPGNKIQSAAESSFDAWIKGYRPNENSVNSTISYYGKGNVIGNMLDLQIIHSTKGQKSLDDVFRYLWDEYYKKQNRGFTDAEFQKAVELIAGTNLDEFFRKNIYSAETIDYNKFFNYAGLVMVDKYAEKKDAYLGANITMAAGKVIVTTVLRNSPAWKSGINVNDEIIAVNGHKAGADLMQVLSKQKPGDKIKVTLIRDGIEQEYDVVLARNPHQSFKLEMLPNPTPQQTIVYNKWLSIK